MSKNEESAQQAQAPAEGGKQAAAGRTGLIPFDDLERWFEHRFGGLWPREFGKRWLDLPAQFEWPSMPDLKPPFEGRWPKVDVVERDGDILVRAELPGVTKEDLDISVTDRSVTLKARTRSETKEEREHYHRREIRSGEFERTLTLPEEVDPAQASATLKEGVLELVLRKTGKSARRSVPVQ
ncbi:MAG: Hsp20/alpha crystallin family protein [Gammaproteobacteria bacterium]